jgi:hypothetical protein
MNHLEYKRDDATVKTILSRSQAAAASWAAASNDCHQLWSFAAAPMMPDKFFAEGTGRNIT